MARFRVVGSRHNSELLRVVIVGVTYVVTCYIPRQICLCGMELMRGEMLVVT